MRKLLLYVHSNLSLSQIVKSVVVEFLRRKLMHPGLKTLEASSVGLLRVK